MTDSLQHESQEKLSNLKLLIIGLGLIGGSAGKGLKQRQAFAEIIGYSRSEYTRQTAVDNGVIDTAVENLAEGVVQADVILIAVPTLSVGKILEDIAPHLCNDTIVTDAASVKGSVQKEAIRVFGCLPDNFVLGHPIAGSEKSGVNAANGDLYIKHQVLITPGESTNQRAVDIVTAMWQCLEADVEQMTVDYHDDVLAATSHLPHLLAYSLVNTLAKQSSQNDIFHYAAGGFRDFTRIASSDPTMWKDIFLANANATVKILDAFSKDLQELKEYIEQHDGEALMSVFTQAKEARDYFSQIFSQRVDAVKLAKPEK